MIASNENPEKKIIAHCVSVRTTLVASLISGLRSSLSALLSKIFLFFGVIILAEETAEKTPLMKPGDWFGAFIKRSAQTRNRTSAEPGGELYSNFVLGPWYT